MDSPLTRFAGLATGGSGSSEDHKRRMRGASTAGARCLVEVDHAPERPPGLGESGANVACPSQPDREGAVDGPAMTLGEGDSGRLGFVPKDVGGGKVGDQH